MTGQRALAPDREVPPHLQVLVGQGGASLVLGLAHLSDVDPVDADGDDDESVARQLFAQVVVATKTRQAGRASGTGPAVQQFTGALDDRFQPGQFVRVLRRIRTVEKSGSSVELLGGGPVGAGGP